MTLCINIKENLAYKPIFEMERTFVSSSQAVVSCETKLSETAQLGLYGSHRWGCLEIWMSLNKNGKYNHQIFYFKFFNCTNFSIPLIEK